jgi:hypothetical protein
VTSSRIDFDFDFETKRPLHLQYITDLQSIVWCTVILNFLVSNKTGRHRKEDMDPIKRARLDRKNEQRKRIGKYNNITMRE